MRLLAVDTTAHFGSVALVVDGHVQDEVLLHSPEGFSPILFGQITALLSRQGTALADVDAFAAAAGPGSFTGVRVGLTAVKGWAEALGKPAFAVSNLRALAECGTAEWRACVLDARRGEVYGALYDAAGALHGEELVLPFPAWLDSLPDDAQFVSPDFAPFRAVFAGTRFAEAEVVDQQRALAGAVGRVATQRWMAGERPDPVLADANYVRRSDAELMWRE